MSKKQKHLINLILCALLAAMSVVLDRIIPSIKLPDNNISFGFLPVMICGMFAGPLWGGLCGAVADLAGALIFPFGAYFPGFTATAFLMGTLYGIIGFAAGRSRRLGIQVTISALLVFLTEIICTLLLNSLWLSFFYSQPYFAKIVLRIPQAVFYLILKTVAALLIVKFVLPPMRKAFRKG